MTTRPTASVIIIGDEILNGHTRDTNSHFLCQELYKCGVKVARVSVIPDDVDIIADEVSSHSHKYSFVLTSGGIGPTHDDVTYEGIAKAFDEQLVFNKDLQNKWRQLCFSLGLDEKAASKMSCVPESAEIHHSMNNKNVIFVPIVSVKNIFIFPGIPSYLKHAFSYLRPVFSQNSLPYFHRDIYLTTNEFIITDILNKTVQEYEGQVKIGSYPIIDNEYYQVKISLEADSVQFIDQVEAFLRSHFPSNSVVGQFPPSSDEAYSLLKEISNKKYPQYDKEFAKVIAVSKKIFQDCFNTYDLKDVCLSFNGGKDCTVLLHFAYLFVTRIYPAKSCQLKVLYVRSKEAFPEIESFIQLCVERYNLNLIMYENPIKDALYQLQKDHPNIKAILMGSRHTDPHCSSLKPFQMTDHDWPQFMRVSPLVHWTYSQVWRFLRSLEVPYCSLYDKGYTSLGCQHNTLPNKKLLRLMKDGTSFYCPAYLLDDPEQEREGRSVKHL